VRAFVVWEPVLFTDWFSPSTMTLGRVSDSRAAQFWDRSRLISHSLGENDRKSIAWDYIAVYAPGLLWDSYLPQPSYRGGPVIKVTDEARAAIASALTTGQQILR